MLTLATGRWSCLTATPAGTDHPNLQPPSTASMLPSHRPERLRALDRVVRSVVVTGCEDDDLCFRDDVDEAVLVVDPP
jgi:hypothetical protein